MKAVDDWRRQSCSRLSSAAFGSVTSGGTGSSVGSSSRAEGVSASLDSSSDSSSVGVVGVADAVDPVDSAVLVDWDTAFSRLRSWPLYCSDEDIGRMTPRQTFDLWVDIESWLNSLLDGASSAKKLELPPLEFKELESLSLSESLGVSDYYNRKVDEIRGSGGDFFTRMDLWNEIEKRLLSERKADVSEKSMLSIRGRPMLPGLPEGLGLERYECFEIQDGEVVDGYEFGGNIFTVPLPVVLARTKYLIMELARRGALQSYGVVMGDLEGANRFAAHMSRQAEMIRGALERVAFQLDASAGLEELSRLNAAGYLNQYKARIPECSEEEFLRRFHAYLIECGLAVKSRG